VAIVAYLLCLAVISAFAEWQGAVAPVEHLQQRMIERRLAQRQSEKPQES
jgi:hypothetical protein